MTSPGARLRASLSATLRSYLDGGGEAALQDAYEIGRRAMQDGLGLIDLAEAHGAVLLGELQGPGANANRLAAVVDAAAMVLRESAAPFEMAQRGYREANGTLQTLNAKLEERARELASAHVEVKANYEVIRQQRDALIRAQRQKDQLTAFVVHDLKNPLSGIILNATVLARDPKLGAEQKATATSVVSAAKTMNRMVMDIMDIGRSEDGALVLRRTEVDLAALVDQVGSAMRSRADSASQRLETWVQLASPSISADTDLLRRTLENLVDNALRHTPRGGNVAIVVAGSADSVEIRVQDSGPGIPEADRARVFEKYVQLDSGYGGVNRAGRGLGLLFCRLAVEAHGGSIWIESAEAGGTVFCVRLPSIT